MINMQQQQANEDMYGNEVKRRRMNDAGDHLKVWDMSVTAFRVNEEKGEIDEVDHHKLVFQEPIQIKREEDQDHQLVSLRLVDLRQVLVILAELLHDQMQVAVLHTSIHLQDLVLPTE